MVFSCGDHELYCTVKASRRLIHLASWTQGKNFQFESVHEDCILEFRMIHVMRYVLMYS